VCVTGSTPIAVTNCLNFGSPEDPGVMWQFAEAVRGLADGCLELGIPVTGGNVSFYNQTGDVAILPTPIVGVLGVIEDVRRRVTCDWGTDEARIYLLGTTHDEFGGSQWAHHVHGHLGGLPPRIDLEVEQRLGRILVGAATAGMLIAAHDVSDGGVATSLVEMALRAQTGARCQVPVGMDPFVFLFSESASRAIVVPNPQTESEFLDMCLAAGLPATRIGEVSPGPDGRFLRLEGLFEVPLDELKQVHEGTFPRVLDDPASA
jgi:phosphoribosylformylglycinamidine synthase